MWVAAGILILCSGVKNGKPGKPLKKIPIITIGWKISNMDLSLILIGFEKGPYKKLLISHYCSDIAKSRGVLPLRLGAQSSYVVKYFEGSNAVEMTTMH